MVDWIFLALVALVAYVLLQRSVARFSAIPWRILWVVMLTPPTVVVVSQQVFQLELPPLLVLILFLVSYITSMVMLRRGGTRSRSRSTHTSDPTSSGSTAGSTDSEPTDPASEPIDASSSPPQSPQDSSELDPAATSRLTLPEPGSTMAQQIANALTHTPISEVPRDKLQGCFPWTVFYVQNMEYRPQAIICRGNLRVDPSEAYAEIQHNVEQQFGNRFLVVLQEGFAGKPFFALIPNPAARRITPAETEQPALAIGLALFTVWTTMLQGALATGVDPEQVHDPQLLLKGLPYALGIMAILGAHEIARYSMARWHQIKTSLPYFIPVPFALGTFGAFIQLKEPVRDRKTLFDLGVVGPLAGISVAIVLLLIGLAHSSPIPAPIPDEGEPILIQFQPIDPSLSILLAILAKLILGGQLEANQVIELHPLAFAGWLGLVIASLNLMPIGQLDGGHIVHSVYGQQAGVNVGRVTRLLVLILALTIQPWLRLWALLLFFISSADEPALNDVTELNEGRDLLGLLILTILALIVLPAPPFLLGWLGLI